MLEFEGVVRSKEVFPVFVSNSGELDSDLAQWLLDRAGRGKREDWERTAVPLTAFEAAVATAASAALERLLFRKDELTDANRTRVEQEREKLSRYYEYRTRAAAEKLESVRRVHDRVRTSADPGEQRIVPVWAKNVENAERVIASLQGERDKRLMDLNGREQVAAQHELLTVSYVEIVPDTYL